MDNYKVTERGFETHSIQADYYVVDEVGSKPIYRFRNHLESGTSETIVEFINPISVIKNPDEE